MSRDDDNGNKKRKIDDSGVGELEEDFDGDFSEALCDSGLEEFLDSIVERLRRSAEETSESNSLSLGPFGNESAGLEPFNDLAADAALKEGLDYYFDKKEESGDSLETPAPPQPPNRAVASAAELPQSRIELEQLFLDIFTRQLQGTVSDSSLLEELRRLLPNVARTHVNALIGHMLDWIALQRRSNNIRGARVLAPMVHGSNTKVQGDPTVHSGGVRAAHGPHFRVCSTTSNKICLCCKVHDDGSEVENSTKKRGPYKCCKCGKLLKHCSCIIRVDGEGGGKDDQGRKYRVRLIDKMAEKMQSSIDRSMERALEFLRTEAHADSSESGDSCESEDSSSHSTDGHLCGYCQYPKKSEDHKSQCILGPGERFSMGDDGNVYIVKEGESVTKVARAREEGSDGGYEKDGDSTMNQCHPSGDDDDERKPAAKGKIENDGEEDDDEEEDGKKPAAEDDNRKGGDKDGDDRTDDGPDENPDTSGGFAGVGRYAEV